MVAKLHNEGRIDELEILRGTLNGSLEVKLFTAPATPVPTTAFGDFAEATFSGYAGVVPTFGSIAIDSNGNAKSAGTLCTFTHNGGGTANTVLGYYVVDTGGDHVHFSELFASPQVLNTNGQFVSVTPVWYLGKLDPPL